MPVAVLAHRAHQLSLLAAPESSFTLVQLLTTVIVTDAIIVVVSEETHQITLFHSGRMVVTANVNHMLSVLNEMLKVHKR